MTTKARNAVPRSRTLSAVLGRSHAAWTALVGTMQERYAPLEVVWLPAKLAFGRYCRLIRKKRTLLYLMPKARHFEVVVVLGERATALALASELPDSTKQAIRVAPAYPEGHFIRFPIASLGAVPMVLRLVELKTTPK